MSAFSFHIILGANVIEEEMSSDVRSEKHRTFTKESGMSRVAPKVSVELF